MDFQDISPVSLSTFGLRREPSRPKKDREPGYEARYDFDTLFYDLFLAENGRQIIALCPPLLNCEATVKAAAFRLQPGSPALLNSSTLYRHGGAFRIAIPGGPSPQSMTLEIGGTSVIVPVQPSGCALFADRKVLFTLSKDNPLSWIRDWAIFHVREHGVDAIAFYDNGSTAYGLDEIRRTLEDIDGVEAVLVRSWKFPYGPGTGPNGEWDSNYCRNRAIAHARWRYCQRAQAVLNMDIDELLIGKQGGSVFDRLVASGEPCLTVAGRWVTAVRPRWRKNASIVGGRSGRDLLHSDCIYLAGDPPYLNKWIADPRRCGDEVEWLTHAIVGPPGFAEAASIENTPMIEDFEFRHCRQISTGWKYTRNRIPVYRPDVHAYDRVFADALMRTFPDRAIFRQSGGKAGKVRDFIRQF